MNGKLGRGATEKHAELKGAMTGGERKNVFLSPPVRGSPERFMFSLCVCVCGEEGQKTSCCRCLFVLLYRCLVVSQKEREREREKNGTGFLSLFGLLSVRLFRVAGCAGLVCTPKILIHGLFLYMGL